MCTRTDFHTSVNLQATFEIKLLISNILVPIISNSITLNVCNNFDCLHFYWLEKQCSVSVFSCIYIRMNLSKNKNHWVTHLTHEVRNLLGVPSILVTNFLVKSPTKSPISNHIFLFLVTKMCCIIWLR